MSATFQLAATFLAGLGLFFVGIKLITGNLKNIAGRTFRDAVAQASANAAAGALWGALSGFITQSGRTTSYIVASFVHSGLLPVRRALPIVLWANAGCSFMVVAAVLPTQYLILLLVGFSGICLAFEYPPQLRNVYGAVFGAGLLLFGLTLVKSGASGFIGLPWFGLLLDIMRDSALTAFLAGLLLTFIVQSHLAVILIAIAMAQSGLFTTDQILMLVYGTHAGSSLITYALGVNFRGAAEQVIMGQVLYNLAGTALFVGLFYAESLAGIPLVKASASALSGDIAVQAAYATILFNLVTPALLTAVAPSSHRLLERLWPPSEDEALAHTKYLHEDALDQPETAALLAEKEQLRLLQRLPDYLDALRTDRTLSGKPGPATYHAAFEGISERILGFLADVLHTDIALDTSERLLNLRNRQDLLATIEEDVLGLYQALRNRPAGKAAQLGANIVEVLDTMLLTVLAAAETGDADELELLAGMTADRGEMMERVRKSYLSAEENLPPEDRALVLYVTHLFERTAWSLGRYGKLLARSAAR